MLLEVIDSQGGISTQQSAASPLIWAMTEGRIGDDRQVIALAQAIGGRVERIEVRDGPARILAGRLLDSFGLHASWHAALCQESPLPDVMVAAGGRCASLARWIKKESGGRTKVVVIGRPWARLADFDLVITTPQYGLPARDNVQMNLLPLNALELDPDDKSIADWAERFSGLPAPWTGVLLGGDSGSFRFTRSCAERLAQRLNAIAAHTGGSLLITTSARTPRGVVETLQQALTARHFLHAWQPRQIANPMVAILALSARLLVTGESASMIAEAVNTGRPVELFQLRERRRSRGLTRIPARLGLEWLVRLGPRLGYWTPPRDMRRLQQLLEQRGLLCPADAPAPRNGDLRLVDRDLARMAARVRQLLAPTPIDEPGMMALPRLLTGQSA